MPGFVAFLHCYVFGVELTNCGSAVVVSEILDSDCGIKKRPWPDCNPVYVVLVAAAASAVVVPWTMKHFALRRATVVAVSRMNGVEVRLLMVLRTMIRSPCQHYVVGTLSVALLELP